MLEAPFLFSNSKGSSSTYSKGSFMVIAEEFHEVNGWEYSRTHHHP
jgi:hypothetical protein